MMNTVKKYIEEELDLKLSEDKSGIKHSKKGSLFLGYEVKLYNNQTRLRRFNEKGKIPFTRRTKSMVMQLHIPKNKITNFCVRHGYGILDENKSLHRSELINLSDAEIISTYNAELRGFTNYYQLSYYMKGRLTRLFLLAKASCVKTLAAKHRTTRKHIYSKYSQRSNITVNYIQNNQQKKIKLYSLKEFKYNQNYFMTDKLPNTYTYSSRGGELIQRLKANQCEYCGTTKGSFEVHHINKLKNIKRSKDMWQKVMIARNRKTLILCKDCHEMLHKGTLPDRRFKDYVKMESRMQ